MYVLYCVQYGTWLLMFTIRRRSESEGNWIYLFILRYSELYNIMKNCNKYNTVYINKLLSVKINVGQHLPSWRNIDYKKSVSSSKKLGGGVLCILY